MLSKRIKGHSGKHQFDVLDGMYVIKNTDDLKLLSQNEQYWSDMFIQTKDIDASQTNTWHHQSSGDIVQQQTKIDIVFIVDNSGSMSPYINGINDSLQQFGVELQQNNYDYGLGLVRYGQTANGTPWTQPGAPNTNFGGMAILTNDGNLVLNDASYFKTNIWSQNTAAGAYQAGYHTIYRTVRQMNWRQNSTKIIILVTDQCIDQDYSVGNSRHHGISQADAINQCVSNNVMLFTFTTVNCAAHNTTVHHHGINIFLHLSQPDSIINQTDGDWFDLQNADFTEILEQVIQMVDQISGNIIGMFPIGNNTTPFTGTYIGNGYTISNLTILMAQRNDIGMFGVVNGGAITNVKLSDVNIQGYNNVGGLVGRLIQGHINNSYVTSSAGTYGSYSSDIKGRQNVGGLVGYSSDDSATGNYIQSTGTIANVYGRNNVGGLIGYNNGVTVSHSYSHSTVQRFTFNLDSFGSFIGGLNDSEVKTSYTTGPVIYANDINPTSKGFVGIVYGNVTNPSCYFDINTTNQTGSPCQAIPRTSIQLKQQSTYHPSGEWLFGTIWQIVQNTTYPWHI